MLNPECKYSRDEIKCVKQKPKLNRWQFYPLLMTVSKTYCKWNKIIHSLSTNCPLIDCPFKKKLLQISYGNLSPCIERIRIRKELIWDFIDSAENRINPEQNDLSEPIGRWFISSFGNSPEKVLDAHYQNTDLKPRWHGTWQDNKRNGVGPGLKLFIFWYHKIYQQKTNIL